MAQSLDLSDRYLITAGCSFVEIRNPGYLTWAHWLEKETSPKTHYNEAICASSNDLIARRTIYRVEQLLQSGVSPDDLVLIISWSGMQRYELFMRRKEVKKHVKSLTPDKEFVFTSYVDDSSIKSEWLCCGWSMVYDNDHDTFRNLEISIIRTLENILMVQLYLNARNIKYIMMTFKDIFSNGYTDYKKRTVHRDDSLIKDNTPEAAFLWDMIDFDKFLFTQTPLSKYGGLLEYSIYHNVGFRKDPDDMHPHEDGHILFTNEILLPKIKSIWQI